MHEFMFNLTYNLTEYAKELMLKAAEICSCEDDKLTLPDTPPPLASTYEHPDKRFDTPVYPI